MSRIFFEKKAFLSVSKNVFVSFEILSTAANVADLLTN